MLFSAAAFADQINLVCEVTVRKIMFGAVVSENQDRVSVRIITNPRLKIHGEGASTWSGFIIDDYTPIFFFGMPQNATQSISNQSDETKFLIFRSFAEPEHMSKYFRKIEIHRITGHLVYLSKSDLHEDSISGHCDPVTAPRF